ncbi:UNVERIFIED_CONTAM: hypothetical protein NCL1_34748 [Trichonephila clavipes]
MDRAATSRALSQELGSFARQQMSSRIVRRRLQQQERLQWYNQRQTWTHEWQYVIFSDESRSCLQNQDGRIRVWWHRGEHTLVAFICLRHTSPSSGVMVWGAFGYTS